MTVLFYLPLEPYKERYTCQLAAPRVGWQERNWLAAGMPYRRVEGRRDLDAKPVTAGVVLDAAKRSLVAFSQVEELLGLLERGAVTSSDVVYLDDFWHPGIEALPYAFHLLGVRPRVYAFLYAQSVDAFDFTHPMREWMRHFERGISSVLDGIFVASTLLKELVVEGGIAPGDKVHVTGLVFDPAEVLGRMPAWYREGLAGGSLPTRADVVAYTSRWDREKDPLFFLRVAERVMAEVPSARFVVCTGAPKARSNDPALLTALHSFRAAHPERFRLAEGLSKEGYYAELCGAKVQFNCADQDWVSFTLLEASVAGCVPCYPNFRSFPEALAGKSEYLYTKGDVGSAAAMLVSNLRRNDLWTADAVRSRQWVHERFAATWQRILSAMGLLPRQVPGPYEEGAETKTASRASGPSS